MKGGRNNRIDANVTKDNATGLEANSSSNPIKSLGANILPKSLAKCCSPDDWIKGICSQIRHLIQLYEYITIRLRGQYLGAKLYLPDETNFVTSSSIDGEGATVGRSVV